MIKEEMERDNFIRMIRCYINYWLGMEGLTQKDKLEGLAFSICSMLDGCSGSPYFVAPILENGKLGQDISGYLHEIILKPEFSKCQGECKTNDGVCNKSE